MEECHSEWRQADTPGNSRHKKKNKRKKSRALKARLTSVQTGEPKSKEDCLTMKLDKDNTLSNSESSLKDTRKVGTNKAVRINTSEPDSVDTDEFCYNTILNSGTKWTILGRPAWSIINRFNHLLNMSAVDDMMSRVAMQLCGAVTAILNGDGQ
eukprot:15366841-Ditylum_brightwellii.AAC.3